ncbi:MAG: hypothetical protein AAF533_18975 [Acidobacteriota bacterium]
MWRELWRKELRQHLPFALTGALAVGGLTSAGWYLGARGGERPPADVLRESTVTGSIVLLALVALFGGQLLLSERRAGGLRFLLARPVSATFVFLSKHLVGVLGLAFMAAPLMALDLIAQHRSEPSIPSALGPVLLIGLALIAACQLLSVIMTSGSFLMGACLLAWAVAVLFGFGRIVNGQVEGALLTWCLLTQVVSVGLGAWLFGLPALRGRSWLGGDLHWFGRRARRGPQLAAVLAALVLAGFGVWSVQRPPAATEFGYVQRVEAAPDGELLAIQARGGRGSALLGIDLNELETVANPRLEVVAEGGRLLAWLPSGDAAVLQASPVGARRDWHPAVGATIERRSLREDTSSVLARLPGPSEAAALAWSSHGVSLDRDEQRFAFMKGRGEDARLVVQEIAEGESREHLVAALAGEGRGPTWSIAGWDADDRVIACEAHSRANEAGPVRIHVVGEDESTVLEPFGKEDSMFSVRPCALGAEGRVVVVEQVLQRRPRPESRLWAVPLDGSAPVELRHEVGIAGWLVHPERPEVIVSVAEGDEVRLETVGFSGRRQPLWWGPRRMVPVSFSPGGHHLYLRQDTHAANAERRVLWTGPPRASDDAVSWVLGATGPGPWSWLDDERLVQVQPGLLSYTVENVTTGSVKQGRLRE